MCHGEKVSFYENGNLIKNDEMHKCEKHENAQISNHKKVEFAIKTRKRDSL